MSDCRSCGAGVVWAETVPGGRKVPLDRDVVPTTTRGALIVVDGRWAYSRKELVQRLAASRHVPAEEAERTVDDVYEAHLSHFSSCPNASKHRKGKP